MILAEEPPAVPGRQPGAHLSQFSTRTSGRASKSRSSAALSLLRIVAIPEQPYDRFTPGVDAITGRPATSVRDFVAQHGERFGRKNLPKKETRRL
jgi:hypothetical protein